MTLPIVKPPALRPGDTIAIVSPSSGVAHLVPRRFQRGIEALTRLGYRTQVMPHAQSRQGHRAASYAAQAADLNAAFADPSVKLILSTLGGYTSNGLLRLLDWDCIAANPKIVMGFSDTTALLVGIHACTGLVTFNGPALLFDFADAPDMQPYTQGCFLDLVEGRTPTWRPSDAWTNEQLRWDENDDRAKVMQLNAGWQIFRHGYAEGRLVGGNLTILMALAGSRFFPEMAGHILFIEDDEESSLPYWDLRLNHLRLLGAFDQLKALIIGRHQTSLASSSDYGFPELLADHFADASFPVAWHLDFGHTQPMMTLPLGIPVAVDTQAQTLRFLEAAVQG